MKRWLTFLACSLALLQSSALLAEQAGKPITRQDDAVVKELEGRYTKFAAAARSGDMATFRALRTAEANQAIPPGAKGEDLKAMAEMMAPALSGFQFVQMETKGAEARMVYRKKSREGLSFLVLMFEKDAGGWKIGANHSQDFIGQTPSDADGLKQALASPEGGFRAK